MTEAEFKEAKRNLRRDGLAARRGLTAEQRAEYSQKIMDTLLEQPAYLAAKCVFAYSAMEEEVHTEELLTMMMSMGKKVCLPHIIGVHHMEAVRLKSIADLEVGEYDILTVKESAREVVPIEEIDCVIVPGVAFSRDGARVGIGGGYYDEFLARTKKAPRLALTYSCQIVDQVPLQEWDQKVDTIITENEIITCR